MLPCEVCGKQGHDLRAHTTKELQRYARAIAAWVDFPGDAGLFKQRKIEFVAIVIANKKKRRT
jgi:hypothetical protein